MDFFNVTYITYAVYAKKINGRFTKTVDDGKTTEGK